MEISTTITILSLLSLASAEMTGFIVGGQLADIKDWHFIAAIIAFRDAHTTSLCGSSLISSQTVLTAAHCLDDITNKKADFDKYKFMVLMGHSKFTKATVKRLGYDYKTHEKYDLDAVMYDIGVLFLNRPVEFQPPVRKVLMVNKQMEGEVAKRGGLAVAGWGQYTAEGPISQVLKSLNETLIDRKRCYKMMDQDYVDPGTVCSRSLDLEEYAYSGDSGGPLARLEDSFLVGIVSYKPVHTPITVYTSVAYYYSWVAEAQRSLFTEECLASPPHFVDST